MATLTNANNPSLLSSHSARKICLTSALIVNPLKHRQLCVQFVPASEILKKVKLREICKTAHNARKILPSTRIFCQQVTPEQQDGGMADSFDFPSEEASESHGIFGKILFTTVFLGAGLLQAAEPVHAELKSYSPDQWGRIWITTGGLLILYFFVVPLIIYNFLRLRWYKRSLPETIFQFMLVFIFFPGMLLLAPFINFRPLPKGSRKGP